MMPDDEDNEEVCRVCHGPAEEDEPLYHPCRCSGSIKHVHQVSNPTGIIWIRELVLKEPLHLATTPNLFCLAAYSNLRYVSHDRQDCLMEWLRMKGGDRKRCELCRVNFVFTPKYAEVFDTCRTNPKIRTRANNHRTRPAVYSPILLSFFEWLNTTTIWRSFSLPPPNNRTLQLAWRRGSFCGACWALRCGVPAPSQERASSPVVGCATHDLLFCILCDLLMIFFLS
jgi:hypothetical protein